MAVRTTLKIRQRNQQEREVDRCKITIRVKSQKIKRDDFKVINYYAIQIAADTIVKRALPSRYHRSSFNYIIDAGI